MPWRTESPVKQRRQFIYQYFLQFTSFAELCADFGISRKTGYKWVLRFQRGGPGWLDDRSHCSRVHPNETPEVIKQALLDVRRKHPSWGPKKLIAQVAKKHPRWDMPHPSTVSDLLNRHGLVARKRRRRKPGHPGAPQSVISAPNMVWSADFKGQFKLGNGEYCYPLTVTDNYSRYLLMCQGLTSTNVDDTVKQFLRLFREFGLPERIRTDNGVPFATTTLARLSKLSALWVRLGIFPELIEPGCPQQNGKHERMHRTLKDETTRPPASTLRSQQDRFDAFREEYNNVRPHEALEMRSPADVFHKSRRELPAVIPELEYPEHYELRYVSANGGIRWGADWVNVSSTLAGQWVGLEEIREGIWNVHYGNIRLGRLHEARKKIEDAWGRLLRK